MAGKTKTGSGALGPEHLFWAIVAGAAIKFAADELALIAEHGFNGWRHRRFGW